MANGLNTPPQTGNARLDQFLQSVKSLLDSRLIRPGPGRSPTTEELEGGTVAIPSTSDAVTTPPAPTNVGVDGGFGIVFVSWDVPTYAGHSHAEVLRANTDAVGSATAISVAAGGLYVDSVTDTTQRYYWVRFVNTLGQVGPMNAVSGTTGRAANDPAYMLELLTGRITESQLYSTLGSRIELIDAPAATAGSVNYRLAAEAALRASEDSALSTRIDTLAVMAGGNTAEILAAISQEQTARISGDTGLATQIDQVISTATTDRNNATAAIQTEQTTRANADSALSTRIDTVVSTATTDRGNFNAAIVLEQTTRANADGAMTTRIDNVVSTANTDRGNFNAAIQTEQTTRANADSTMAGQIQTIQTTVGGHSTSIQEQASSIDGLEAQYTVKIDNNGYVSGFGLASTPVNGAPYSAMIVRADSFSVSNPSGPGITPIVPFTVQTTPTTINGENVPVGVYMDGAYMKNGTITNAKLGNAVITSAKIGALQVLTGHIDNLAVTNAKISDLNVGKITAGTLAVNQYIQSVGYAPGSTGWKIDSSGYAEFSNIRARGDISATSVTGKVVTADNITVSSLSAISATVGMLKSAETGERMEIQDGLITVYDSNNIVRVRMGVW